MSLSPGRRQGPYEVVSRLGREVAVNVPPRGWPPIPKSLFHLVRLSPDAAAR